jgi:hypothetical protein
MSIILKLFQNSELSTSIWAGVGMLTAFWHVFYPFQLSMLGEKQLVEISPKFDRIKKQYVANLALWAFLVFVVIFATSDGWALKTFGVRFYPQMEISFALLGVLQASFALSKGVYPQAVSPIFVYGDERKIRRIAFVQIIVAIAVAILSVYVFTFLANLQP